MPNTMINAAAEGDEFISYTSDNKNRNIVLRSVCSICFVTVTCHVGLLISSVTRHWALRVMLYLNHI